MSTTNPESPTSDSQNPNGVPFPPDAPANPKRSKADVARENGAKSKGPTSDAGKKRSRGNARTHHFTATSCTYSNQNCAEIDSFNRDLRREFNPRTPTEMALVDIMANCLWQQRTTAEELAAFVNHTRLTHFSDPALPGALQNMLAVDKLTSDGRSYENHHRYQRDAQRRHARALRDLLFYRKNQHLIDDDHSADFVEIQSGEPATQEVANPINAEQNEPTEVAENNQPVPQVEPTAQPMYPPPAPPDPATAAANSDVPFIKNTGPAIDRWEILKVINRHLLPFPEAFRAVADAVCEHEDKRLGKINQPKLKY